MDSWAQRTSGRAATGGPGKAAGGPTFTCRWSGRNNWGGRQTPQPRAPVQGNEASNLWLKTPVGVEAAVGETPSLTGEFGGETHRVPECTQAKESAPPRNQHQKGPTCLWVAEKVTENQPRAELAAQFLLGPLPHIPCHSTAMGGRGYPTLVKTYGSAPYSVTGTPRQRNMAQMKEQIKALKRERSNEEIANLSDRCTVQNTGRQDAHRNGWVW